MIRRLLAQRSVLARFASAPRGLSARSVARRGEMRLGSLSVPRPSRKNLFRLGVRASYEARLRCSRGVVCSSGEMRSKRGVCVDSVVCKCAVVAAAEVKRLVSRIFSFRPVRSQPKGGL